MYHIKISNFIFSSSAVKLDGGDVVAVSIESGIGTLTVSDVVTSGVSGASVSSAEVVEVSSETVPDGSTPVTDEGTTDIVDTSSNVAVAVSGSLDGSSLSILASAPLVPVSLSDSCEYINSCHVTFLYTLLFFSPSLRLI